MTTIDLPCREQKIDYAYLCVDAFMGDAVGARALQSALELGVIDHLRQATRSAPDSIATRLMLEPRGLHLLLGILRAGGVVDERDGQFELSVRFGEVLQYRDLLEAKLDFASLVAPDFLDLFSILLTDPGRFMECARLFDLFSYDRCFEATPENLAMTRRWMRFTTALTKYEAQPCMDRHDFSGCKRLLDVGGNSGEFVLRVCRAHPGLRATVFDLPLVCDIGRENVAGEPEAARIDFIKTAEHSRGLPTGFDTVCFKSMLHDWPDAEMTQFLRQAHEALDPGGTLLIFERGPIDVGSCQIPYSLIPVMLFFRSYRTPAEYVDVLQRIGFREIDVQIVELETSFIMVTAVK